MTLVSLQGWEEDENFCHGCSVYTDGFIENKNSVVSLYIVIPLKGGDGPQIDDIPEDEGI
jgi:hypothetical protein